MGVLSAFRIRTNNRIVAFFICLLISLFLWLFTALSKEYTTTINLRVSYSNIPADKLSDQDFPEMVKAQVRSSGFRLANYFLFPDSLSLLADLSRIRRENGSGNYYLELSPLIRSMNDDEGLRIVRFIPDSIRFHFSKRSFRKVPVKVVTSFTFREPFQPLTVGNAEPGLITLSGSESALKKYDTLYTKTLTLEQVSASIDTLLPVRIPEGEGSVIADPDSVRYTLAVDKFTEKEMEIPVEVLNIPAGHTVRLFPGRVKVIFLVPFSGYSQINPEDFRVVADFERNKTGNYLQAEVDTYPKSIRQVRTVPARVEFILVKQ